MGSIDIRSSSSDTDRNVTVGTTLASAIVTIASTRCQRRTARGSCNLNIQPTPYYVILVASAIIIQWGWWQMAMAMVSVWSQEQMDMI